MSKLTPEQIRKIHEAKAAKEAQRLEAKQRREAEKLAAEKEAADFIEREFGEPAPVGNGVSQSETPTPLTVDAKVSDMTVTSVIDTPHAGSYTIPVTPEPELPAAPSDLFRAWLRTPEGLDASDPRMPNDTIRRSVFLEDALQKAFVAGFNSTQFPQ